MSRIDSRHDRDYDSDDSTLVNSRRYRPRERRTRYRSPSEDSSYSTRRSYYSDAPPRLQKERGSKYDTLGKASIAVGLLQVVAGLLQLWTIKKGTDREKAGKERKRKEFAKAKAARRRHEDRWERQREWDDDHEESVSQVRRIGYAPSRARSRSRAGRGRQVEALASEGTSRRTSRAGSLESERSLESDRRSRRGR